MIRYKSQNQLSFEGFETTFENQLDPSNRWVKLAELIPWDNLASSYYKLMNSSMGAPSKDARLIIGALVIKHKMNLADEEVIEQLKENMYMQYFVGYASYQYKQAFAPSLFVEIRKRLGKKVFDEFTDKLIAQVEGLKEKMDKKPSKKEEEEDKETPSPEEPENRGKLLIDASVAPQEIKYPTDLNLLNECRQKTEELIDKLWLIQGKQGVKPRTYRRKARQAYLSVARKRKKSKRLIRRGIGKQLNYLKRNIGHIESLLDQVGFTFVGFAEQRQYWIIQEIYRQQRQMYEEKSKTCSNRIVSIHQPHIRPIVRGKDGTAVEFGAQIGVSLVEGMASVDHLSWEAYHEGKDLIPQVEKYFKRYGFYPECVLADKKYGTQENRRWLKQKGIRFGGVPLGRPPKEVGQVKKRRKQQRQDELERIPIEGKFGQARRAYQMGCIRAKTKTTSESWIYALFLVMNITRMAKELAIWILPVLLFLLDFLLSPTKIPQKRYKLVYR